MPRLAVKEMPEASGVPISARGCETLENYPSFNVR